MEGKAHMYWLGGLARHLRHAQRGLWLLASAAVLLATLMGGPGTAFALPPEPIDSEPDEPAEVPDHFTWSMVARFGNDADGDGVTDYTYDPAFVNAATFRVKFKACPPPPGGQGNQYAWEIDGAPTSITSCSFSRDFTPGSHHVKFTATPAVGLGIVYEEDILVRDILIVSLGDSFASGEGNPDIPQQFDPITGFVRVGARWVNRQCHRSAYGGPAQAALAIEQRDPHTSVTFVSLACSGAEVRHIVSDPYMGPEPGPDDPAQPPQLKVLQQIVGPRRIDALLVSGGGNDLGFGNVIADCILEWDCETDERILNRLQDDLARLPTSYWLMSDWIALGPDGYAGPEPGLNVADVYITEYPNLMHDADGDVCDSILGEIVPGLSIDKEEVTWAESAVFVPLNAAGRQAVESAAASYPYIGWHYVDGVADAFAGPGFGHGYCAWNQAWVRRVHESTELQGPLGRSGRPWIWDLQNTKGTMHPTAPGHQVYRDRILAYLLPDLFPDQPLPDGPSFSAIGAAGSTTNQLGANGWVTGSCDGTGCASDQAVLEVVATDPAEIRSASVAVAGVPACDASSVAGVTCTPLTLDTQHTGWRFDLTAEGIHRLEFAVRNGNDQVAGFTHELKLDLTDPTATAAVSGVVPNAAGWYTVPVSVTLSGADAVGGLGLGSGVYLVDYTLDGVPGQVSPGGAVQVAGDGVHTLAYQSVDLAGRRSLTQTLIVRVDTTAPAVSCTAPDGLWHADDVSLGCTASDSASGLASAADAAFNLATSVAAGSETADAATGSRSVCDLAGNCTTAGPIGGNMVDKKGPTITLTTPANTTYVLGQVVAASYSCADGGSGVASCAGPVASGSPVDTASTGIKSFAVNATDNVGNSASQSVSYTVTFNVCVLYDQTKSHRLGSTVPIKLQVCDAGGASVSAAGLVVTATGLSKQDNSASNDVEDSGNANPDSNFRFDEALDGYIYNLSTSGLSSGTWVLSFMVAGDPVTHTVQFDVR